MPTFLKNFQNFGFLKLFVSILFFEKVYIVLCYLNYMKKYLFLLILLFVSGCIVQKQLPSELVYPETELPPEIKNCEQVYHNPDAMPFSDRDLCYYNLALKLKNPNICSKIVSETFIDDCYVALERVIGDYRICGLISYDGSRGLCYLKHLKEMPVGIEFCEYLTYGDHKSSCINKFTAITPGLDYKICDNLEEFLGARNTCYKNIALTKGDLDSCKRVSEGTPRNECYKDFAVKLKDKNLCDLSGFYKEQCLKEVGTR